MRGRGGGAGAGKGMQVLHGGTGAQLVWFALKGCGEGWEGRGCGQGRGGRDDGGPGEWCLAGLGGTDGGRTGGLIGIVNVDVGRFVELRLRHRGQSRHRTAAEFRSADGAIGDEGGGCADRIAETSASTVRNLRIIRFLLGDGLATLTLEDASEGLTKALVEYCVD